MVILISISGCLASPLRKTVFSYIMRVVFAFAVSFMIPPSSDLRVSEASAATLEYRVKAAFLINFAKFVEWPERAFRSRVSPIVFVIAGEDPFGNTFDTFRGQTIGGRPIVIQNISIADDVPFCHVLFIPKALAHSEKVVAFLQKTHFSPILTITDGDIRSPDGERGMIHMFEQNEQVSFIINNALARKSELSISAKLLSLAARVIN